MDKEFLDDLIDYLYTQRDYDDKADELYWRAQELRQQLERERHYANRAV